jgi:hypothetical protein
MRLTLIGLEVIGNSFTHKFSTPNDWSCSSAIDSKSIEVDEKGANSVEVVVVVFIVVMLLRGCIDLDYKIKIYFNFLFYFILPLHNDYIPLLQRVHLRLNICG